MHNQGTLKRLISDLEMEHRDLDNVIEQITKELPFDQLQVQRLKKRKLSLKDQLILLKSRIIPDTIA
ncbi:MAG: DUF465 domain-containing protein [Pseudomonadota bacterium]|nr:DUF465 domain-containing protein [Pseudomonadota bacterium]